MHVVEGHASACPRTGGVGVKYGALTLGMCCGSMETYGKNRRSACRVRVQKNEIFIETNSICSLLCVVEDKDCSARPLTSTFSSPPGREMECTQLFQVKR